MPLATGIILLYIRPSTELAALLLLVGLIKAAGSRRAHAKLLLRQARVEQVDYLDGTKFELFSAEVLRANGYHVKHVGRVGDFGADLIITSPSGQGVVQLNRYSGSVDTDALREAAAARAHYRVNEAIVLTNSYFTPDALALARTNDVKLWDRDVIVTLIAHKRAQLASMPTVLLAQIGCGFAVIGGSVLVLLQVGVTVEVQARPADAGQRRRRRRLF